MLAGLITSHMEIEDKLSDLARYLGHKIRCIQWALDAKTLSDEEFRKLTSALITCEKLHLMVLNMVLPF